MEKLKPGSSSVPILVFWWGFAVLIGFNLSTISAGIGSQILGGICVVALWFGVLFFHKEFDRSYSAIERKLGTPAFFAVTAILCLLLFGSFILDFEGLNGTKWDLAQYIQATRNWAVSGKPTFTFMGKDVDYHFTHRSISLPILGTLYKIFPSPYLVLLWQPFCFVLTALGMVWIYREICFQKKITPTYLGYLSAALLWLASVVVLRQRVWPITFHILGPPLLAMAFLAYLKRKWSLALFLLILLPFEKEDYAMIAAPFAIFIAAEIGRKRVAIAVASLVVAAVCMYAFFSFWDAGGNNVPFEARYGNFGRTANEAVKNFIVHPGTIFKELSRPLSREYIFYFFVVGLGFASLVWDTLRFFVVVFPMVFLQSISNYEPMQRLKDGYALTPAAGALLHALLTSRGSRWISRIRFKDNAFLIAITLFCLSHLWPSQSASFTFRQKLELYSSRRSERSLLAELRKDKDTVICCHERLCSLFADRDFLIDARFCKNGAPVLDRAVGKQAVFIEYQKPPEDSLLPTPRTANAFVSEVGVEWEKTTDFLKISKPRIVQVGSRGI